jgi:nitrite reductase/ring-hydroxylating ferredoxin subunit
MTDLLTESEVHARASRGRDTHTLADGTYFGDLIDLDERSVSARLHSDAELYKWELERVFARSWIAVAHESEIPRAGDYVTRYIGEDPVIVSRDRNGGVNIMLNACSHRGMTVCRAEVGNAKFFRCPYHAWTYDPAGKLVAVSAEKEMYDDNLDKSTLGLKHARAEVFAGMIFGNWSHDAPTVREDLGEYAWYLEMAFARSRSGLEVLGPPQRWTFDANWKLAAEQFAGDAYHTVMLHNSLAEMGLFPKDPTAILHGVSVGTERGHTLRCLDMEAVLAATGVSANIADLADQLPPPPGMSRELARELGDVLAPDQVEALMKTPPVVGQVFPTLGWVNMSLPNAASEIAGGVITFRTWVPRGPEQMELMSWTLVERDAPEELRQATARSTIQTFSDSGIFEQDDSEAWSAIQRSVRGVMGRDRKLIYTATLGEPTKERGGLHWRGMGRDDVQWLFWQRYRALMLESTL